jgi:hypothetical protein
MRNAPTFRWTFFLAIVGIAAISPVNGLRAQTPATETEPPAFEVASVKPNALRNLDRCGSV